MVVNAQIYVKARSLLYSLFFYQRYSKLSPGVKYRFAIFVYYLCSKLFIALSFLFSLLGFRFVLHN